MSDQFGARSVLLDSAQPLREALVARGYAATTIESYRLLLISFAAWPAVARLEPAELSEDRLEQMLRARERRGALPRDRAQRMRCLVGKLRDLDIVAPAEPNEIERALEAFRAYLRGERRLAELTVRSRGDVLRRFLAWRAKSGELALPAVTVRDVHAFVLHEAHRLSRRSLGPVLDAMRSFLRYAFATGILAADLSGTLPPIATREHPLLRRTVDVRTLELLLGACDRDTAVGLRDYAILTMLARLGLRANEVAAMRLDDVYWRVGELLVRGNGGRVERMPLPSDVGEPLADYLRRGRPASEFREVFLRSYAPAGPLGRNGVVFVPRSASARAGIPTVASHRLRHTTASSLLAAGASWTEVSQVLRHSRSQTTAIYTSLEPHALDGVARPWPGARS